MQNIFEEYDKIFKLIYKPPKQTRHINSFVKNNKMFLRIPMTFLLKILKEKVNWTSQHADSYVFTCVELHSLMCFQLDWLIFFSNPNEETYFKFLNKICNE